jgi:mannose-6-phosphate isomerase-like protein (cupin superfamily)
VSDYTVMRAGEAPDYTGGSDSPFVGYGRPMASEQLSLNVRRLAPGASNVPGDDPSWGHSHRTIEELYFVVSGRVTVRLDSDEVELGPLDAVRMAPAVVRAARNDGDEEAVLLMCSVRVDDPMAESVGHEGFWPGQSDVPPAT